MNRHDEQTGTFAGSAPANRDDEPTGTYSGTELPVEAALRLEEICDAFESKWRAKGRPDIWAAALELPEALRSVAVEELIELDIFYRKRAGEQPVAEDYSERFPEFDSRRFAAALRDHDPNAATATGMGLTTEAIADRKLGRFGDYELIEEIAHGAMGVVFRARAVGLDRIVALKMIRAGEFADPAEVKRFRQEAEAAATLDHPNIVSIFEVGERAGQHYYAMRLVEGGTLATRMSEFTAAKGTTRGEAKRRQTVAANLLSTVARAVHHAHQRGVLHRDLKPANILLDEHGEPHVTDFGLARRIGADSTLTRTGAILGTPNFMAPEQARSVHNVTTAVDVYGLGAVLYQLLAGRPPFQGEDILDTLAQVRDREVVRPQAIAPMIDRDLETICLKCLDKNPDQRYGSAEALADDLDRWGSGEPILARPIGRRERVRKWMRRNPAVAGLIGVAAALVAVISVGGPILLWRAEIAAEGERNERAQAIIDRDSARDSERLAQQKQLRALMAEAQSQRSSRRIGQRFETLDTIREAVALAKRLEEPTSTFDEIRNLAVGALALPDIRKLPQRFDMPPEPGWRRNTWSVNHSGQLVAETNFDGAVSIRRVSADPSALTEVARLPKSGVQTYVEMAADGRHLIVWSRLRPSFRVQLWRMDGDTPRLLLEEIDGCVQANLTADGRTFVTVNGSGIVRVYDVQEARLLRKRSVPGYAYTWYFRIQFHPTESRAYLMAPGKIIVFDWQSGREVDRISIPGGTVFSMAIHPTGEILYLAFHKEIQAWHLGRRELVFSGEHLGGGAALEVDPSGEILFVVGWSEIAKYWDAYNGRERFSQPAYGSPRVLADNRLSILFPDEFGTGPKQVKEFATGREYRTMIAGVGSAVTQENPYGSLHPDGRLLAVGTRLGIGLLDIETGRECAFIECGSSSVYFDGMGDLWTSYDRGRFRHRVAVDDANRYSIAPPEKITATNNGISETAGDRRGAIMAAAVPDGVRVWERDRPSESELFRLARPIAQHNYLAVSPDGKYFACGSHNSFGIRVWDRSGKLIREFLSDTALTMPAFSPDGKWLYEWHGARWRVDDWSEGPNLRWGKGVRVRNGIAYAPDMSLIAVDSGMGSIILLDASGERELVRLEDPNQHNALRLIFTPDGTKLLTLSTEGLCLHVWDLRRIREGLVELGLDWDAPSYPRRDEPKWAIQPLDVTIIDKYLWFDPQKLAQYERVAPLATAPPTDSARAEALGLDPTDVSRFDWQIIWLWVQLGDAPERKRVAARLLARYERSNIPHHLFVAVRTSLLFPDTTQDQDRFVAMAKRAIALTPRAPMQWETLGLARYRAGEWRSVFDALRTAESLAGTAAELAGTAAERSFLRAMAHWQLGEKDTAHDQFTRGVQWMARNQRPGTVLPTTWRDSENFRAEAAALLGLSLPVAPAPRPGRLPTDR